MSTINNINPKIDTTVRVFDSFYSYEEFVSQAEYDVVYSFFRSVIPDAMAAGNFTMSLFRIASETQTPVLTLLQNIEANGTTAVQLTQSLTYYLNNLRSPATLLGLGVVSAPNQYTARNVLA
jgi:pyruvate/2-oxoacid:ferredoxin oxidoreductase alpha subunit